jgi:hypothetical protein
MPAETTSRRRGVARWVDAPIVLALFICSGIWGTVFWNRAVTGGLPFSYQTYFEPAVMIACGKGFVVAQPPVPAVTAFLAQREDRLSCDAIPADATLGTYGLYQGAWRYLMLTVGFAWRVLGVSWKGMGPLFGVLFGVTIVAAYAIFRLGMGPLLAALCACAIAVSKLHLVYLPILRDYAKAPFALILIFLLGLLVTRRPTWRSVLPIAAAYGVVLGFGYGFRTDFLASIPPFFLTLTGFLDGGLFRNLRLKAAAGLLCALAFVVTAWPIISSVYRSGGCQWHTALLGFSRDFSGPLGVDEPPYELNRRYLDEFVYVTVTSYAGRARPGVGHIEYCWPDYDRATGSYLRALVTRFPADIVVRAYASVLRIVELPFAWERVTQADREAHPPHRSGVGLALVLATLTLATVASARIGLFLLFFLLYFGGYPAIQFDGRHYFHLEFITWWAAGFLLHAGKTDLWPLVRARRWDPAIQASVQRAILLLAGCGAVLILTLWTARAYQQPAVRSLLRSYLGAARDEIPLEAGVPGTLLTVARTSPATDPETADFLEVDINAWRCGERPAVTFRYDSSTRNDFSRTFTVQRRDDFHTPTHILTPVYDGFRGIELSDTRPGCVDGLYRLHDSGQLPVMLEVLLSPGWESAALYQRLGAVRLRRPAPWP